MKNNDAPMPKTLIYFLLFAAGWNMSGANAQTTDKRWSLEDCIRYAVEHNIDLKQKEQIQENRKIDLSTTRHSWLPNLNASLGQNFDFGRSPTKEGIIVDRNSTNSSFSIQTSMPLFTGLRIYNQLRARKLDLLAATENMNKAKDDLSVNVTSYYLQVLYNQEILRVADLQVALSREQADKTQALVETGKVPLSQLYDIKAQLAKDEVTQTDARNNVNLALLNLAQCLEMEHGGRYFRIADPIGGNPVELYMSSILPPDAIYEYAVTFKPQVREQELLLESSRKGLLAARSSYFPQLNLNAYYSNGYYHYNTGENVSFSNQLKQNERKNIGFSLSIPLFNRFTARNAVRSSRIAIRIQELSLENTKKELYKEIQQAYYNAVAAQEKYNASEKAVVASLEAFKYAEERYNAGKSTVYEFNDAKTKYAQSLAEQAQAKYDYILRTKILDFYNGTPIRL